MIEIIKNNQTNVTFTVLKQFRLMLEENKYVLYVIYSGSINLDAKYLHISVHNYLQSTLMVYLMARYLFEITALMEDEHSLSSNHNYRIIISYHQQTVFTL